MAKERNLYLDIVKFVLIYLVIVGHCLQTMKLIMNLSFMAIYSFHMPLFMGLSGFLAYKSIRRHSLAKYVSNRFKYILPSILSLGSILALIDVYFAHSLDIVFLLKQFLYNSHIALWFLWAILLYSIVISILYRFRIDNIFSLFICSVLLSLIDTELFSYVAIKSFFIFFGIGYCLASLDIEKYITLVRRYIYILIPISFVCIYFFKPDYLAYYSPYGFEYIGESVFRLVTGCIVSATVLVGIYYLYQILEKLTIVKYCARIGEETMPIYIMQSGFFMAYIQYFTNYYLVNYSFVFFFFIGFFLLLLFYGTAKLLSKNKYLGFLLFGKKI